MGLKTKNYTVKSLGITVKTAYAKVTSVKVDVLGNATAEIAIQQTREDLAGLTPLEEKHLVFTSNGTELFARAYSVAKENDFKGWEDDIIPQDLHNSMQKAAVLGV